MKWLPLDLRRGKYPPPLLPERGEERYSIALFRKVLFTKFYSNLYTPEGEGVENVQLVFDHVL